MKSGLTNQIARYYQGFNTSIAAILSVFTEFVIFTQYKEEVRWIL
jgi:hypothetical protein